MLVSVLIENNSIPFWRQVEMSVIDGLGIQERFSDDIDKRPFRVIHVKSGVSLMAAASWYEAWEMREWLSQQVVNGVSLADLPICEMCDLAPVLLPKIQERFPDAHDKGVQHFVKLLECVSH